MTNEEFEKRKEFILEQQAQFAASMNKSKERLSKVDKLVSKVEDQTEEAMSSLAVKMAELAKAQARTDQRLNILTDIINKGRNGKSQN